MKVKVNMEVKFIVSLLFSVLVAIFAIQNAGNIQINFLFAKFTISQAVVILGSAILGAIIVLLLGFVKQIKQSIKIKQLTKEIGRMTEENNTLQGKLDDNIATVEGEKVVETQTKEDMSLVESEKVKIDCN